MRLSRKADYALGAVRFLSTLPKGKLGSIDTIAEAESIPRQFLAKILKALTKGGILVSYRGVKGGYQLARPAREISFLDIIEAINGPLHLNLCTEDPECGCSQEGSCDIRRFWLAQETSLIKALKQKNFGNISPRKK
jgi:Rrf2 family protein